jgi:hypothetical protein
MMINKGNEMSGTIDLVNGKYVGSINGKVIVKSTSKYYVQKKMDEMVSVSVKADAVSSKMNDEFPIDTRFDFVHDVVTMVATKKTPSVIITGEGGLGKSYSVVKALKAAGLKDMTEVLAESDIGSVIVSEKCFTIFKGYSTAKALYRTLYENRNSTIVFDDCDSILKDTDALNVLKGALDSFDKRIISWNSELKDDSIPRMFQFKGSIVFISNMSPEKLDQALKSRSMCIDLGMTLDQKLERMATIIKSDDFLPNISIDSKKAALEVIAENKDQAKEVSLRTLISTAKIAENGSSNWKQLAKYMLIA